MVLKKIIIVLVLLGFIGTGCFIVNRFKTMQTAHNRPKTQSEKQQIAFYKKYNKKIGQTFTIDSIAITIDSYEFVCSDEKTMLYCRLTLTNNSTLNQRLMASYFALKNDSEVDFFPEEGYRFLLPNTTKKQVLIYTLPPRISSLLNYRMHFESKIKANEKAMISIAKSYCSEG